MTEWKHPVQHLLDACAKRTGIKRDDLARSRSDAAVKWRKVIVFVAIDKFLVSLGNVADQLETEQSTVAQTYRRGRVIRDQEEFFCEANDLYQLAFRAGARPVRSSRAQKLERKVAV